MTCEEYVRLLNQPDGADGNERESMREHVMTCEQCADITMRHDLARLDDGIEVPDAFAFSWRRQIREDKPMDGKGRKPLRWRGWLASAAAALFLVGGTLGTRGLWLSRAQSPAANDAGAANGAVYGVMTSRAAGANDILLTEESYTAQDSVANAKMMADTETSGARTAKIIREASFTINTRAFDADYQAITALVKELGGRVAYTSVSGDPSAGTPRVARLTLRVPTDKLDAFLAGAEGVGDMTNMTQSAEDVSETYYDLQARLDTQRKKMERLQELMGKTENVADLIEVETAVADTQYMIDSYQSRLQGYDSRVDDSEVTVTIREVKASESVAASLGERMSAAIADSAGEFVHFLQDMLIFLLAALPWLLAAAVVTVLIVLVVKKKKREGN